MIYRYTVSPVACGRVVIERDEPVRSAKDLKVGMVPGHTRSVVNLAENHHRLWSLGKTGESHVESRVTACGVFVGTITAEIVGVPNQPVLDALGQTIEVGSTVAFVYRELRCKPELKTGEVMLVQDGYVATKNGHGLKPSEVTVVKLPETPLRFTYTFKFGGPRQLVFIANTGPSTKESIIDALKTCRGGFSTLQRVSQAIELVRNIDDKCLATEGEHKIVVAGTEVGTLVVSEGK